MHRQLLVIGCSLSLAWMTAGCGSTSSPGSPETESKELVLTGASTIAPLANDIAKRFEESHAGVRIDVQTGGSSRGIADTRRKLADIGMVSRPLKDNENDLKPFIIARDGVCMIVHADNRVSALTDEQIVDIFKGKIRNWKEVGGADAEIVVVNKAAGRSTLELFLNQFGLEEKDIHADVVIGDNEQGIKTVAGNPYSIGYVSIGAAEFESQNGVPLKLLPIGSVAATIENVRNGSFPLARPLHLVTLDPPSELAREFIEYAQTKDVVDLIEEHYFVPLAK